MLLVRLILLLSKTRKRQAAFALVFLSSLYLIFRLFGVIPEDVQSVVTLLTTLLSGFIF